MNIAVFFQKHESFPFKVMRYIYVNVFLCTNSRRIKFLRDSGAVIGEGVKLKHINILGSEPYLIEIGNNTSFGGSSDTSLITHDGAMARTFYMGLAPEPYDIFGRIKIGNNCFIGAKTTIMKNVTIGDNCIIGAGSIVTKDIPDNSVACGIPAKVICSVDEYYHKHEREVYPTVGMGTYSKRKYIEDKI